VVDAAFVPRVLYGDSSLSTFGMRSGLFLVYFGFLLPVISKVFRILLFFPLGLTS
jgi:hypothetical protein